MNTFKKILKIVGGPAFAVAALALSVAIFSPGCEEIGETIDNIDSRVRCAEYCNKRFSCENYSATDQEKADCIANCRDSMEDNCGNENQAAANDQVGACVDKPCAEFWTCMIFETAPECFGFVGE